MILPTWLLLVIVAGTLVLGAVLGLALAGRFLREYEEAETKR